MDARDLAGAVALALTFALFVPYVLATLRRRIRPQVCAWIVWGTGTVVVGLAQAADGAGVGALPLLVSGAISLGVAVLAARHGDRSVTRGDGAFLAVGLGAIGLWLATDDPLVAVLLLTASDLAGFGPVLRRARTHPEAEQAGFYALGAVRNALVVAALEHHSAVTVTFPAVTGLACLVVAGRLVHGRRTALAGRRIES